MFCEREFMNIPTGKNCGLTILVEFVLLFCVYQAKSSFDCV